MRAILISLSIIFMMPLMESCISEVNSCDCGEVEPYYDFDSIRLNATADGDSTIILELIIEDISYLSTNHNGKYYGSALLACTCLAAGYQGLKNQITMLSISSNTDFGASLPAGTDISAMDWEFSDPSILSVEDLIMDLNQVAWSNRAVIVLRLNEDQTPENMFRLKVSASREDGTVVEGESALISFGL